MIPDGCGDGQDPQPDFALRAEGAGAALFAGLGRRAGGPGGGAAVILGAKAYIAHREATLARRASSEAASAAAKPGE